ncbi:MAG TPA: CrcB family protein [Actinocrinis sp.]|nr:CrcB family protein [Actinocrinis sp.]
MANSRDSEPSRSVLPVDPDVEVSAAPPAQPHTARVLAAIAVGGFAGGVSRYELGLTFPTRHGAFPATTFAINVSGSFVLALLLVFVVEIWPPTRYVRPLLGVGFCGAYTTFSTWMVDTDRLLADRHYGAAALNVGGSLAAGLAATCLGLACGRAVLARRRLAAEAGAQSAAADKAEV